MEVGTYYTYIYLFTGLLNTLICIIIKLITYNVTLNYGELKQEGIIKTMEIKDHTTSQHNNNYTHKKN